MAAKFKIILFLSVTPLLIGNAQIAFAEGPDDPSPGPSPSAQEAWRPAAIGHLQNMLKKFPENEKKPQKTPPFIPGFSTDPDAAGLVGTYQPSGRTVSHQNDFFSELGTNQRTCITCHQPQTGWTVSASDVQRRFMTAPIGFDPIFRKVDGANCPNMDASSLVAMQTAYSLLLGSGLIRVGLKLPDAALNAAGFRIVKIDDPYGCSATDVVKLPDGTDIYSFYRRPVPSTVLQRNVGGVPQPIMWDGREPSLVSQFVDATHGHAQGDPLNPFLAQAQSGVQFEAGLYTAQERVARVNLAASPASGGSQALSGSLQAGTPRAAAPDGNGGHKGFDLFPADWLSSSDPLKASMARGQAVFNKDRTPFGCAAGPCHNVTDIGSNAAGVFFNTRVANAGGPTNPANNRVVAGANGPVLKSCTGPNCAPNLPTFHVVCNTPANSPELLVHDLGLAMISGKCSDLGKFKVPNLRGLSSRAPYFHDGSAQTLADVVNFYDARFNMHLTAQEKQDLLNFLEGI